MSDAVSVDEGVARRRRKIASEHAECRRFSGSVHTQKAEAFASAHAHTHASHADQRPIALRQVSAVCDFNEVYDA